MKFTVSSADLLRALSTVNGAVPSKSTLPILECVLFEREEGTLRIAATDLEISIVQRLPVTFEQNGTEAKQRIAVPARRLLDTLRALPDLSVTVATDAEFNIELTTDQGRYKMVGFDGGDYPALPSLDGAQAITAEGALVKHAIDKTGFAASKDALRPAMMGVLFQVRPENATIVATDGHRLVKLVADGITAEQPVDVIVPAGALALAGKAASEGTCTIRIASGYVGFDFGDTQVIGRLIEEQYPNYEAVIPVENEKRLTVGRDAMLAAVRRVALYSSSMTHQIRLALGADALTVSAEDIERASEAKERVLCDYDAEPMEIGFNSQYLQEVLSNVDGEDVVFEFSSPNRAGVVSPAEGADGEELLMLIMPVMLNTYA
ncbi:DNA polymerase III subunit beta [Rubrivirga sp. SAORIC476]|uniref:DNA polymerase III subunit beta n=1 Tax=Rubrivirga sp. SAORIC476 TaxID=1961794 RepID=UPI000BA9486D|nr:DNA polymerase III subunit beta [Rubrivirga sp. SAORIC476]MAQ92789.1 DNA polymerase III subunit beta [Rhodothermaceae bacterium]MBC14149.1 DNA polymerase III subunit beta [Rhodothermaceae bacterium]PAP79210.1 DNA polymerase III subunit beta [Rubrivirga sp. SAORIC476]